MREGLNNEKMIVEIKKITEKKDDIYIFIKCRKPHQKETPWSHGREELDKNNELFQQDSEQHRQEMNEYEKRALQLHLGEAILTQDGK
jgi:hypothetical protein